MNAAIGITAAQSLLVGCDIVIVEGVSDQFYLTMIKNYLIAKGKFKPKRELAFIPVGGAKGVKPVVSIVYGNTQKLPFVLLDSDETGKSFQKSLTSGLYKAKADKEKVLETDSFCGKTGSEIEDLMPLERLLDSFEREFRLEESLEVDDVNADDPIMPQLEKIAAENDVELELGWKVEVGKRIKQKFSASTEVDDDLLKQWEALFKKFQSAN